MVCYGRKRKYSKAVYSKPDSPTFSSSEDDEHLNFSRIRAELTPDDLLPDKTDDVIDAGDIEPSSKSLTKEIKSEISMGIVSRNCMIVKNNIGRDTGVSGLKKVSDTQDDVTDDSKLSELPKSKNSSQMNRKEFNAWCELFENLEDVGPYSNTLHNVYESESDSSSDNILPSIDFTELFSSAEIGDLNAPCENLTITNNLVSEDQRRCEVSKSQRNEKTILMKRYNTAECDYQKGKERNEVMANINNLRDITEDAYNDEISFLIEGIIPNNLKVNSSNSLLLSSLIDLALEIIHSNSQVISRYSIIIERIIGIHEKLSCLNHSNSSLLLWLICIHLYLFSDFFRDNEEKLKNHLSKINGLDEILDFITINATYEDISDLNQKHFELLRRELPSPKFMQIRILSSLKNHHDFIKRNTYHKVSSLYNDEMVESEKAHILSYYENYYENNLCVESINQELQIFDDCMKHIGNSNYSVTNLYILKLLVILSTNYADDKNIIDQIFQQQYAEILIKMITRLYKKQDNFSELEGNLCLFSLGYLINFYEKKKVFLNSDIWDSHVKSFELLQYNEGSEIYTHLMGYNSIFLTHAKLQGELNIEISKLVRYLQAFKNAISNRGICIKIDRLLSDINTLCIF